MPAAGPMVYSILTTLTNGEEREKPILEIVGKPNKYAIELIMREHGITDQSRMIMIGDRPDTDIKMGNSAGIKTCLTLTGVV